MSLQGLDDRVRLPGPEPWVVRRRGMGGLWAPPSWDPALPTLHRPLLCTSIYWKKPISMPWSLPPPSPMRSTAIFGLREGFINRLWIP